jgi:hypothetical protein
MNNHKKCIHCAMQIPADAKICPYCRKSLSVAGKIAALIIIGAILLIISIVGTSTTKETRTPPDGGDPSTATYKQVFREYEICMNEARALLTSDKQRGQEKATRCFMKLQTYGQEKAKKAFMEYHEHYGL